MIDESRDSVGRNWGQLVLQIGTALFYYKLGQTLLQNRAAITNWGRCYKLGQLLQIGA